MVKEFPPNKWFRKFVTPGRLILGAILYLVFLFYGPRLLGVALYSNIVMKLLCMIIAFACIMVPYQIYWMNKYRVKPEFCKECGRAKPIKYEE